MKLLMPHTQLYTISAFSHLLLMAGFCYQGCFARISKWKFAKRRVAKSDIHHRPSSESKGNSETVPVSLSLSLSLWGTNLFTCVLGISVLRYCPRLCGTRFCFAAGHVGDSIDWILFHLLSYMCSISFFMSIRWPNLVSFAKASKDWQYDLCL